MSERDRTWKLEDHLCRKCGGRILRCVTETGMTPGGNSLYQCTDCGARGFSIWSPSEICWCGFSHRRNEEGAYRCMPFSILEKHPELLQAFLSCGCDPKRGGVVGEGVFRDLRKNLSRKEE